MNLLYYLIPKENVAYVEENYTIRQAIEKMEFHRYSAIPILDQDGYYKGTLREGDILWFIKNEAEMNLKKTEHVLIKDIPKISEHLTATISSTIADLVEIATNQNFIPVIDGRDLFIGIVTRKDIMQYLVKKGEGK